MNDQTPYISPEFLAWLEKQFGTEVPDRMPENPREYDFLAGKQFVVNSIRRIATRQEKNLEDY